MRALLVVLLAAVAGTAAGVAYRLADKGEWRAHFSNTNSDYIVVHSKTGKVCWPVRPYPGDTISWSCVPPAPK